MKYTDEHRMAGVSYHRTDIRRTFAKARKAMQAAAAAAKVNAEGAAIGRGRVTVVPRQARSK